MKLSSLQARYGPSGSGRAGTRRRVQPRHKAEGFSRQRVFSTLTMMRVDWPRGSEADRAQFFIVVHRIKNYLSREVSKSTAARRAERRRRAGRRDPRRRIQELPLASGLGLESRVWQRRSLRVRESAARDARRARLLALAIIRARRRRRRQFGPIAAAGAATAAKRSALERLGE